MESTSNSRVYRLTLAYDGTGLSGWQRQPNDPTVQQHLEDAVAELVRGPFTVVGASRTDAGVHAEGQVVSLSCDVDIPPEGLMKGLNTKLPPAIAVRDASLAATNFNARFASAGKLYRYQIQTATTRDPLVGRYAWHHPRPLDQDAMRLAATHLIGEHDFTSFRATGCTAKTPHRKVTSVELSQQGPLLVVRVRGNAFLRNMVRIIAGTLVDVGTGRFRPEQVAEILSLRDRTRAGQTAPAKGLFLVKVFYPPESP